MLGSALAQAASCGRTIETIEGWTNGNIAFRISGATGTCDTSNWFVLDRSDSGAKDHCAALLASKLASRPVRVWSWNCAPAEAYNASPYNQVDYPYVDQSPRRGEANGAVRRRRGILRCRIALP